MPWKIIAIVVAIVCFVLAACGIGNGRLTNAGLAALSVSFLV